MTTEQWEVEQANDEIIKEVIEALKIGPDSILFLWNKQNKCSGTEVN